jgi:hypothetical protein
MRWLGRLRPGLVAGPTSLKCRMKVAALRQGHLPGEHQSEGASFMLPLLKSAGGVAWIGLCAPATKLLP